MNSNGSEKGRLTRSRTLGESTPSWSPTGAMLAFQGMTDGERRIFVRNAATGVVRQVSSGPSADRFPTWSPDSRNIAYRSLRCRTCDGLGDGDIYSVSRSGGARVKLTTQAGINTDPAWSPDGAHIAFASNTDGNYDIYVMNADGSGVIQLTDDGAGPPAISNRFPNWSPDGTRIAYVSTRNNQNEEDLRDGCERRFGARSADDAIDEQLGDRPVPSWSPSGAKIAFASKRDGDYDIWTMNAADGSGTGETDVRHRQGDRAVMAAARRLHDRRDERQQHDQRDAGRRRDLRPRRERHDRHRWRGGPHLRRAWGRRHQQRRRERRAQRRPRWRCSPQRSRPGSVVRRRRERHVLHPGPSARSSRRRPGTGSGSPRPATRPAREDRGALLGRRQAADGRDSEAATSRAISMNDSKNWDVWVADQATP